MEHTPRGQDGPPSVQDANVDPLDEEAVRWVVRLTSGEATARERAEFDRWRRQSPRHEAAFVATRSLWVSLDRALPPARRPRFASHRSARRVALAASLVLGSVMVWFGLHTWRYDYVTRTGQRQQVVLADGSRVELNSGSAVSIDHNPGTRRVVLARGEAYFNVVHDRAHPFEVEAGSATIRDLGTAFSVRRDGDAVQVTVETGRVDVHRGQDHVTLGAAQQTRAQAGTALAATGADPFIDLAWRRGRLIVEDQTLGQVIDQLDRYYPGVIVLSNEVAAGRRVNAVIDLGHVDDWLAALAQTESVTVRKVGPLVWVH